MTGANKTLNYPVIKTIKITPEQENNWNPIKIRNCLDKKESIDTRILKKLIPVFIEKDIEIDLLEEEIHRIEELYHEI